MNILDFIQQHDSLNRYHQHILEICEIKNYVLNIRYKRVGDIPNKGFFDAKSGVIGIDEFLTNEEKLSCIAHELAHVELFLDSDLESCLSDFENYLNSLDPKVYCDHFNIQFRNTVHHCLIDHILHNNNLSNSLFYDEIQLVQNQSELMIIHDDKLQIDEEGYEIEVPVPISELNLAPMFNEFQRVFNNIVQIEKTLNGNNVGEAIQDCNLYNIFRDFKESLISIQILIEGVKRDLDL